MQEPAERLRVKEQVQLEEPNSIGSNIINLAIVGAAQTDQNKKISAWAAILIIPTIISGIYGMNFRFMPELDWRLGYPLALLLIASISTALYVSFRRRGWL